MKRAKMLLPLAAIALLTTQTGFSQTASYYYYGFDYVPQKMMIDGKMTNCFVVKENQEHFPAQQAGANVGDVIIAVDGQPVNEHSFDSAVSKATMAISVKHFGNQTITLNISGIPCLSADCVAESAYAWRDNYSSPPIWFNVTGFDSATTIMSDPDVDFFRYATFDFEFTGQNVIQQKEIASDLETYLTNRGLKRDRQNPDMLVFIEVFSDRREQYVPPTQQMSTRYGYGYNVWTKQWETRQYVESNQTGNYTQVNYLSKFSIAMADAQKLAKGESETAKIWQADYEKLTGIKSDRDFVKPIGNRILKFFPLKVEYFKQNTFWYTGIIYNRIIAGKVNGVVPCSPADRAGIKADDIIKRCYAKNYPFNDYSTLFFNDMFRESYH